VVKVKAIVLAAGYATRLYPLTIDTPKPLLEVKDSPIIEHIIKKIEEIKEVNEIFIVTNAKFYEHFEKWKGNFQSLITIKIINDQTTSNEGRLGSLGDIKFVLENENVDDDILVIAGDNLFEFSLRGAFNIFKEKNKSVVVLYDVKDYELAKQYGIVQIDKDKKMIGFQEKPKKPKSTLSSTGVYIYPKIVKDGLIKYVEENGQNDKAGNFLEVLHKNDEVYCYITEKRWIDIGTLDQLKKARKEFKE